MRALTAATHESRFRMTSESQGLRHRLLPHETWCPGRESKVFCKLLYFRYLNISYFLNILNVA